MSTIAEIIDAVKNLDEKEKGEFLERLADLDFDDEWDRRMAADAAAGKLDFLVREADAAIEAGTLREWPGKTDA
jgi:hypothetical protein